MSLMKKRVDCTNMYFALNDLIKSEGKWQQNVQNDKHQKNYQKENYYNHRHKKY